MGTRAFVDTNVLVYLYDAGEPAKRARAQQLVLDDAYDLVISTQVLNEFYVTVTRKIATPLSIEVATDAVKALAQLEVAPVTRNLVIDALALGQRHKLSHWDALILESAARTGCAELLTEDLAVGATIEGVAIVNPFAD